MPIFLNPRFAMLLLVMIPLAGGAVVHPHGASAFLMGAWAGVIIVAPPLFFVLWVLRLVTLPQILRPLMHLPILIAMSVALIWFSGVDVGLGPQIVGGGALLWWFKRKAGGAIV